MKLTVRFLTMIVATGACLTAVGCATRYTIKSFPEGATVFVKDVVTQEKKLVGQTPLTLKKTKDMSEVFFFAVEKDNFYPKQILMTPRDGENLTVSIVLDPTQEKNAQIADAKNGEKGEQKGQNPKEDEKKKQQAQEEAMKDLNMRIALLENTVSIYKEALFSGRYSGGMASFDRGKTDDVVDHLFKSQQLVMLKKYPEAQDQLDKALMLDEYLPQAYLIKGTIFYVNKQYEQAKLSWERCLKVDPYNAQAYNYLRLVDKKLGLPQPPDRPSMLRAPASDEFSKSLRELPNKVAR